MPPTGPIFDMPLVFAGLLVLAALGVALYAVFAVFEARVVSWRKGAALGYLGPGRRSFVVRELKAIAIFCGSNFGGSEVYAEGARALGTALAKSGVTLVYGGTTKGLMGVVADAALAAGGQVHGVITERLHARGHSHERLTRHEIAPTLRLRKQRMAALADAFVALPGGVGTLEEFMEVWSQNQLGEFDKPVGLLDSGGFYQPFLGFVDQMIAAKFLPEAHRRSIEIDSLASALVEKLRRHQRVEAPKWL